VLVGRKNGRGTADRRSDRAKRPNGSLLND